MEDMKISLNTKLEVAIEVMAAMIAKTANKEQDNNSPEMKKLLKERDAMYSCDEKIIDKIINEYGPILKKNYENK